MYFPDLTPYGYESEPYTLPNVLSVGWLDPAHPFPEGIPDPKFVEHLKALACREGVNQMRGYHFCRYCEHLYRAGASAISIEIPGHGSMRIGSCEIWVPSPSGDLIYAAPELIVHYVETHHYLPPQEFIEAAMQFPEDSPWDGDQIARVLINRAFAEAKEKE